MSESGLTIEQAVEKLGNNDAYKASIKGRLTKAEAARAEKEKILRGMGMIDQALKEAEKKHSAITNVFPKNVYAWAVSGDPLAKLISIIDEGHSAERLIERLTKALNLLTARSKNFDGIIAQADLLTRQILEAAQPREKMLIRPDGLPATPAPEPAASASDDARILVARAAGAPI